VDEPRVQDAVAKPDEVPQEPGRGRLSYFALSSIIWFPILYILGVGPGFRFLPDSVLDLAYRPLFLASQHCDPLHNFLIWYLVKVWHIPLSQ
jgi:hypothetical protein